MCCLLMTGYVILLHHVQLACMFSSERRLLQQPDTGASVSVLEGDNYSVRNLVPVKLPGLYNVKGSTLPYYLWLHQQVS